MNLKILKENLSNATFTMRVLACDPGYDRLGVAVLDKVAGSEVLIHSDCITTDRSAPIADRLHEIGVAFSALITTHTPDYIAIESLFFSKNAKTAMAVAEARGVLLYLARTHGCTVCEYTPQEIKIAVTGYGKSDKQHVTAMVKRLVPAVRPDALDDEYDAVAVGITALASLRPLPTL